MHKGGPESSICCRSALHLLLASLVRLAGQLGESGEQQLRKSLLARAVTTIVSASSGCLGSFPLPDDSDAGFWVSWAHVSAL